MPPVTPNISGSSKQEQTLKSALDSQLGYSSDVIVGGSKSGNGLDSKIIYAAIAAAVAIVFLIFRRK